MICLFLLFILLSNSVLAFDPDIIINKFQYNPLDSKNEWVELYNKTDNEVDLNNWFLIDEGNTKKLLIGKKIPSKSSLIFEDGRSWLNNTAANNDGDTIFLKIGDSVVDSVDYKRSEGKILVKGEAVSESDLILKGKWIGRKTVDSDEWMVFSDTEGPIDGAIDYFNGYKTILEKINIGITPASDVSGIGSTEIKIFESVLENNNCPIFNPIGIGASVMDGRCYKYEYVATDFMGNSSVFRSNSIVKFDTSPPLFLINNAFRNILKIKSEFVGSDNESGILNYKYGLGETVNQYMGNSILYIGYTGDPKTICGKAVNNAGLESEIKCLEFVIDVVAPKIINENYPQNGIYKIGDTLNFGFEFDENIETVGNNFEIILNSGKAKYKNKDNNVLNFEYIVKNGDATSNLKIGQSEITVDGGTITDNAGNEAILLISDLEDGIEIDGVIPTIGLVGSSYVEIPQFENYLDLGVTVSDGEITTINNVDTDLGGIYENYYTVTDRAGNTNNVVRKIKVVDTTAPTIDQLTVTSYQLRVNSNEAGYVEWQGKCEGENNNLKTGNNLIKIKNNGDGVYDNCQVRAWDLWGNVGGWQKIDSFTIDTTAPIIEFTPATPNDFAFTKEGEINIEVLGDENLKECSLEKEKLLSGNFESGNTDGWEGEWTGDNLHFASGQWSAKSPNLKDSDLVEKSIWQTIYMDSEGELSFWWRVSSEKDWDFLKFYIDGVMVDKISGEVGWQEKKYNLIEGEHTIKFTYSKDYSNDSGEDAGWIDEIKIEGGGSIVSLAILNNMASGRLTNLNGGSTKYKVYCMDLYDNKSTIIERNIIKNVEKLPEDNVPLPTPYTIFKASVMVPTVKIIKPTNTKTPTKTPVKKSSSVLGVMATPSINKKNTPPSGLKLATNVPWEEIKFWTMGMAVLGTTSGVILLDKKKI